MIRGLIPQSPLTGDTIPLPNSQLSNLSGLISQLQQPTQRPNYQTQLSSIRQPRTLQTQQQPQVTQQVSQPAPPPTTTGNTAGYDAWVAAGAKPSDIGKYAFAHGGMTQEEQFITGDPQTSGIPNPELISNPTNAPIGVTPMNQMGGNIPQMSMQNGGGSGLAKLLSQVIVEIANQWGETGGTAQYAYGTGRSGFAPNPNNSGVLSGPTPNFPQSPYFPFPNKVSLPSIVDFPGGSGFPNGGINPGSDDYGMPRTIIDLPGSAGEAATKEEFAKLMARLEREKQGIYGPETFGPVEPPEYGPIIPVEISAPPIGSGIGYNPPPYDTNLPRPTNQPINRGNLLSQIYSRRGGSRANTVSRRGGRRKLSQYAYGTQGEYIPDEDLFGTLNNLQSSLNNPIPPVSSTSDSAYDPGGGRDFITRTDVQNPQGSYDTWIDPGYDPQFPQGGNFIAPTVGGPLSVRNNFQTAPTSRNINFGTGGGGNYTPTPQNLVTGLPSLRYLKGEISKAEYDKLIKGNFQGALGTSAPESGDINLSRYYDIAQDPTALSMLSAIYRSGSRDLESEVSRARKYAPTSNISASAVSRGSTRTRRRRG